MSSLAITLTQSLHGAGCNCRDEDEVRDAKTFFARVKSAHPTEFKQVSQRRPVSSAYIDRREALGDGPKRLPNPNAVPLSRQRRLPHSEWVELQRRRRVHKVLTRIEEALLHGFEINFAAYTTLLDGFEQEFGQPAASLSLHRLKAAA